MESYNTQRAEAGLVMTHAQDAPALPFSTFFGESVHLLERMLAGLARIDGKPRLIMKLDGTLVACCEEARQLLHSGDELRIERGIVNVTERAYRAQFERLLKVELGEVETLILPHAHHSGHWIIRAVRSDENMICLALQEASEDYWATLPDLSTVFGLTPSEAAVVDDLYNGLSAHDISEKRRISIHTVRAHLRRCYDKLHITSREQLWHRLRPYQI